MVAYGVVCSVALSAMGPCRAVRRAQPSRNSFWEGSIFPKPYSGKVVPCRNPFLGRLYLSETLFWEGCTFLDPYSEKVAPSENTFLGRLYLSETLRGEDFTFLKPYSGASHPRCQYRRMTGLRRPVSARPQARPRTGAPRALIARGGRG